MAKIGRVRWPLVGFSGLVLMLAAVWPSLPPGANRGSVTASPVQHIPVIPPPSSTDVKMFRSKIQHIVYILKENRSFDNYFGTFRVPMARPAG